MFTGLIEDVGLFLRLERSQGDTRAVIQTALPMDEIKLGDSIAVNGVCLTVVRFGNGQFVADVSPESLDRTNLGDLKAGQAVNLERALRLSDRLGGHIVSGHVDAVGEIVGRTTDQNAVRFTVRIPENLMRYVVEKGSVAVDGISLTVNKVEGNTFDLALIPHSLGQTTMEGAVVGTSVNIETDILGRYVERLLGGRPAEKSAGSLSLDLLARNGFT